VLQFEKFMIKNYSVKSIKNKECKDWFLNKHYAKRLPSISFAYGLYIDSCLEGVCSFGRPMSFTLIKGALNGLYRNSFLELNRLVVNEGLKKNTLSFFISQCFKQLPKPLVIVSYADTSQNHHGYIYQATNWIYTGLSNKFTDYAVRGLEHMHHSSIEDSVGRYDKNKNIDKHTLLKEKYGDKLYLKERPRKHRYFYFLGTKKQKKDMLKNLTYKICTYPKGDNKRYVSNYVPATQRLLF
tara:strand:- start:6708 stop:7427 length:720 start_codon:yes stop_codon:yes gene_type:complete